MTIAAAPGESYKATLEEGVTGLVGVLSLALYDGSTEIEALSSLGISEIDSSGVYVAQRTAPASDGQYVLVWSADGSLSPDQVSIEELVVGDGWSELIEPGFTAADLLRLMAAVLMGRSSGGGTNTRVFRDVNDSVDRVTATVESDGDRSSITLDP